MASRQGLPAAPTTGSTDDQIRFFSAVKEALEQLLGTRANGAYAAITKNKVTADLVTPSLTALSASAIINTLSTGEVVANGRDYANLVRDVQTLIRDVRTLAATLNLVIQQLKG